LSENTPPVLEFRDVHYATGGRPILTGVSLTLREGETLVLLGRSGSGKTTLLRTANRLIEVTSGDVIFEGRRVAELNPVALRRRIGYVIQEGGLLPHLTVEANVSLVPRLERWPETDALQRAHSLLDSVGLPSAEYARRYPRQLSGGERQRVGIARALAVRPRLLLLDEPFAALDPVTRFDLQRQFLELRAQLGQTSVFVTHDIREALMIASRIALLRKGAVEEIASPEQFGRSRNVEALAFLATLSTETGANAG
jgi:osmoprotectant transport system ATP-binding protein